MESFRRLLLMITDEVVARGKSSEMFLSTEDYYEHESRTRHVIFEVALFWI